MDLYSPKGNTFILKCFMQFTCTNLDGCQKERVTLLICFRKRVFPQKREGDEGGFNPGGNYGVGQNIYLLLFACIVKSLYFSRWNSKWYERLILCLSIFGLKQDNFQKTKFETVISVAYGTVFVYSMASIVFYLACLFVLCLYLLAYFTY